MGSLAQAQNPALVGFISQLHLWSCLQLQSSPSDVCSSKRNQLEMNLGSIWLKGEVPACWLMEQQ